MPKYSEPVSSTDADSDSSTASDNSPDNSNSTANAASLSSVDELVKQISELLPGYSNEVIEQALQRSNYNLEEAINSFFG